MQMRILNDLPSASIVSPLLDETTAKDFIASAAAAPGPNGPDKRKCLQKDQIYSNIRVRLRETPFLVGEALKQASKMQTLFEITTQFNNTRSFIDSRLGKSRKEIDDWSKCNNGRKLPQAEDLFNKIDDWNVEMTQLQNRLLNDKGLTQNNKISQKRLVQDIANSPRLMKHLREAGIALRNDPSSAQAKKFLDFLQVLEQCYP